MTEEIFGHPVQSKGAVSLTFSCCSSCFPLKRGKGSGGVHKRVKPCFFFFKGEDGFEINKEGRLWHLHLNCVMDPETIVEMH